MASLLIDVVILVLIRTGYIGDVTKVEERTALISILSGYLNLLF